MKEFAKLLIAEDGYQVLFVLDRDPETKLERVQAMTHRSDGGGLFANRLSFNATGAAQKLFDSLGPEQAEAMRQGAELACISNPVVVLQ